MNIGYLAASIRLDGIDEYNRSLDNAGKKLSTHNQELTRSRQFMRDTFVTGAQMIGTATVALSAFTVGLFQSGAAYNTLQQTSRAALKTLLGSAEAVNAQMAKLDEFATTSPFSKAVFITAQQQLIGFGMEAKKVVPTLDALQNAVAGFGGSNQDVADLARIIAQVGAAGKITGQDLLAFGARGVDAADLIGGSLGKTGAQIKASITNGTLDATVAIDALVEGMSKKFAGASANVKQTIDGARDRIKAASRDIGAILAEPFIDPNGGGYFVTWGNQVADVMRGIQGHVRPIVSLIIDRATPAFAQFSETLDRTNIRVRSWDSSKMETFLNTAGRHAPAIAGVSGAIVALTGSMLSGIPVIGPFVDKFKPLPVALASIALASPQVREALGDLFNAFRPLLNIVGEVVGIMSSGLNAVLPVVAAGITVLTSIVTPLVDIISQIPTPLLAGVAAFLAIQKASSTLSPILGGLIGKFKQFTESAALQAHLGGVSQGMGALSVASMGAQGAVSKVGAALKAAFISNPIGLALTAISVAIGVIAAAFGAASEKAEEHAQLVDDLRGTLDSAGNTTAATTEKIRDQIIAVDGAIEKYRDFGIEIGALGTSGASTVEELDTMIDALQEAASETEEVTRVIMGSEQAFGVLTDNAKEAQELRDSLLEYRDAALEAEEKQKILDDAVRNAKQSMSDAERENNKFNEALKIMRDEGSSAAEKVNALNQALDVLNGGAISAEEAQARLHRRTDSLGSAFSQTDDKGKNLAKSLIGMNGQIDTSTEAGGRLFDQVLGLQNEMQHAVTSADALSRKTKGVGLTAEEAVAQMKPYADALREQAKEAGLSEEATEALIARYLEIPETTYALITDEGTIGETDKALVDLAARIEATPDKSITITEPYSDEIMDNLTDLGYEIEHLPDGKIKITQTGAQDVSKIITDITKKRYQANISVMAQVSGSAALNALAAKADGGISDYGAHRGPRAANGMIRQPMIAKGGSNILWAEDETIQEAYISRKPGMEARNKAILKEAAGWFGMTTSENKTNSDNTSHTQNRTELNITYSNNSGQPIDDEKQLFLIANQLKASLNRGSYA